jgi:hypothetical protein
MKEMHAPKCFPTNRQMHRKLRAVDSETVATATHGCATEHAEFWLFSAHCCVERQEGVSCMGQ